MLTQHDGVINKPTDRKGCTLNHKAERQQKTGAGGQGGRAGDGGRGEDVDLTFTSAFLLSKVLAAAVTDREEMLFCSFTA